MPGCSSFLHLGPILGIALGLAMGPSVAAAAPLCVEVLKTTSAISQADIDRTIENIARLKISVDKRKSLGSASLAEIGESVFQQKYSDLLSHLKNLKSENEIKSLVIQKINELQGEHETVNSKIVSERKNRPFYTNDFEVAEQIKLPVRITGDAFEYVPKLNSLLFVSLEPESGIHSLNLFNLKTKVSSKLLEEEPGAHFQDRISSDGRFVLVSKKSELFIFDVENGTSRSYQLDATIPWDNYEITFQVNPSGNSVLIIRGNHPHFMTLLDLNDGKLTPLTSFEKLLQKKTDSAWHFHFLSDHEVVYLAQSKLHKYDLIKNKDQRYFPERTFRSLLVSQNRDKIYLVEVISQDQQDGWKNKVLALKSEDLLRGAKPAEHLINYRTQEMPPGSTGYLGIISAMPYDALTILESLKLKGQDMIHTRHIVTIRNDSIESPIFSLPIAGSNVSIKITADPKNIRLFTHSPSEANGSGKSLLTIFQPKTSGQ
jgi:hypothetical protein